ncbi:MAG: DUF2088 domain-containing protein, partial [Desulfofustis sp.]|nr:DUF2088 domain-containing protein [Desulfofustis sp.]
MELDLKYGTGTIRVHIPESAQAQILEPNQLDPVDSVEQELTNVLFRLGASGPSPTDRLGKGAMVAIAIPDETRPLPVKKIMPALLSWLFGTQPELDPAKVTIVVGGGLHPPLDQTTLNRLVPP